MLNTFHSANFLGLVQFLRRKQDDESILFTAPGTCTGTEAVEKQGEGRRLNEYPSAPVMRHKSPVAGVSQPYFSTIVLFYVRQMPDCSSLNRAVKSKPPTSRLAACRCAWQ
jgi:hypothetical protein